MEFDGPATVPSEATRGERPITVLHVDDDPDFVDLTATFLEREREALTVLTETSVDAALDRLDGDGDGPAVDCVVSDYDMPGQDGLDFLRAVRERYPRLPFLLFTGKGDEEIASEAISTGVTDYLQKGTGTSQYTLLANRIENAVGKRDAKRTVSRAYRAMDTAREGMALLDESGEFQYVNQAYAEITGYDRAALIGEHWEMLYPEGHVDRVYEEILPAVPKQGRWSGRTVYEREDGERILTSHALAYADDGTIVCLAQALSDGAGSNRGVRRHRRRLMRFLDGMEEYAIFTLDEAGHVTGWNDGSERLFGYDERSILGDHLSALYTDEDRVAGVPSDLLAEAEATGAAAYSGRLAREDGRAVPVHTVLRAIDGDDDDNTDGFVAIIRDREMEAEEGDLTEALDAIEDVFYVLDTEGNVIHVNQPRVTGYTATEIRSMDPADLFVPADREAVAEGIEQALETGSDVRELRLRAETGERRTYEFCSWTLTDESGEPRRIVGLGRDVSDRKNRERALSDLQRTTQRLVRADSTEEVATLAVDALLGILPLGRAAVHVHHERDGGLVPMAWDGDLGDDAPDLGSEGLAREAFRTGEVKHRDATDADDGVSARSELAIPLDDHGVVVVTSTEGSTFDENDRRLAQLLCENVTAAVERVGREAMLRQRESELERENERLDEFASVVSHDLRNPLNVANGHLELATEECDSGHLDDATQALERMETIIDEVLALARDGRTVDETEPVDLSTVVERCWANVETTDAELRLRDDLRVVGDENRLARMFENLFRNSVEHGSTENRRAPRAGDSVEHSSTESRPQAGDSVEHGSTENRRAPRVGDSVEHSSTESRPQAGDSEASETPRTDGEAVDSVERGSTTDRCVAADCVRITVGAAVDDEGDGGVQGFYVADDGPGVPPGERDRVFEAGYSTSDDGTGFGLRIVRDIVEAHDWRIECVESEAGGARFEITGVDIE